MIDNTILDIDSYKAGHFRQYPKDTTHLFGYLESRGGMYDETLFFGLQPILNRLAQRVTVEQVREAAWVMSKHGVPFPLEGWMHIAKGLDGHIPLTIKAVPEGTIVPVKNALMTVESYSAEVPWIVGWFETQLMRLWYPITVATRSLYCKRVIYKHLKATGDDPKAELPFKLHDFGSRGVSSFESAGIGGAAHLVNFLGTDTMAAFSHLRQHYNVRDMCGFSIPAMEHSTVTSWGKDNEEEAYRNMIVSNPDFSMLAAVSDSYNIYEAVEKLWCEKLLEEVKVSGKTIIIRPDSGDPSAVNTKILEILDQKVGCTVNSKGYKVLPSYFRIIQGDGNDNEKDIDKVLTSITNKGFSASNMAFGMGGGLLQKLDRDTQKFAFKISAIRRGFCTPWIDVKKDPITDSGKASKAGCLTLIKDEEGYHTVPMNTVSFEQHDKCQLECVFDGDERPEGPYFNDIRALANKEFT